jgi:hypothetical protein
MSDNDRLIALWNRGLVSEGIGPEAEWHPVCPDQHQVRHNKFWNALAALLSDGYGDDDEAGDDDLPEWMSERALQLLAQNDN